MSRPSVCTYVRPYVRPYARIRAGDEFAGRLLLFAGNPRFWREIASKVRFDKLSDKEISKRLYFSLSEDRA